MRQPEPPTVKLARAATRLHGDDWAGPVARVTETPRHTLRRMLKAAAEGRDYRGAAEVLARYRKALAEAESMSRMDWSKAKKRRETEEADPRDRTSGNPWTHVRPATVRRFTPEEIAAYEAELKAKS